MSQSKVKEIFEKLISELETTEVDSETRTMLHSLETDIHGMLNTVTDEERPATMLETAELLETRFASEHPVAEGFIRELIDALARMGV